MSRVVVHIESLVLRGVRHEDRHRVAEGLQSELARRLSDPTAAEIWASATVARAPRPVQVRMAHDAGAEQTGVAVARGLAPAPGESSGATRGGRS